MTAALRKSELSPALIMTKARIRLVRTQPFFGSLAMSLRLVEDPNTPTIATDYETIYYNPEFIAALHKQDPLLATSAVAHECGHIYRMHDSRRGQRDLRLWNMAGDMVINQDLKHCHLPIGAGWLYHPDFEGMSTEQVYACLRRESDKSGGRQGEPLAGAGHACARHPEGSGAAGALNKPEREQFEQAIKAKVAQAANIARMQGRLPAFIEQQIESLMNPPECWQDILREWITNQSHDDYSWARPNRRHIGRGFVLPSLYSEHMGELVVVLDSSGSCVSEFGAFLAHLNSIIEDCRPEKVTVIHCDAAVAHVAEYEPEDLPIPQKLHGGGGTDFRPAFNHIEQHGIEPVCMIYFTDTYGSFPREAPDYPVLWAVTNDGTVPWGAKIQITTHD